LDELSNALLQQWQQECKKATNGLWCSTTRFTALGQRAGWNFWKPFSLPRWRAKQTGNYDKDRGIWLAFRFVEKHIRQMQVR